MDQSRYSIPVQLSRALIRVYQLLAVGQPARCRFVPSCSVYMRDALATHGFFRGLRMGTKRILKCHPWNAGGYDPIPSRRM